MLDQLATISSALQEEVDKLNENQARTQLEVQQLRANQNDLLDRYISNSRDIQALRSEFFFKNGKEDVYVFHAPDTLSWFTGRTSQVKEIEAILKKNEQLSQSSARKVAICGLGGSGKTSLAVEYAHRMKGHYQGGVFWFSGEDEKKLENSVNNLALSIGTFVSNSFDVTLSQTLARMSRIQKPWLLIIDDMYYLKHA
jgi:DNA replication protein DnaC